MTKAARLYQPLGVGLERLELIPVEFGRSYPRFCVRELSTPGMRMVSGVPLCNVKMPPACQPPMIAFATELLMFSGLPLPRGSSYSGDTTRRLRASNEEGPRSHRMQRLFWGNRVS